MIDWRADYGHPAYELPLIVETPRGRKDISDWARGQVAYSYWLALRSGTTEWNARLLVPADILPTLEHGKTYTARELGLTWLPMTRPGEKGPGKFQFIVERL